MGCSSITTGAVREARGEGGRREGEGGREWKVGGKEG